MLVLLFKTLLIVSGFALVAPNLSTIKRYNFFLRLPLVAQTTPDRTRPIYLVLSVVWEGYHIRSHNIAALQRFRRNYGSIPLTHFISPAYFLRSGLNPRDVKAMIDSTTQLQDKFGMVLHPWKSITSQAGVVFRRAPNFWGRAAAKCLSDCGADVPLGIYPRSDIIKLVKTGVQVLEKHNFKQPRSFLAGGWLATPHVLAAARANGFKFDYSAIPLHLVQDKLRHYPIYPWLRQIWQKVTPHTQPHVLRTTYGEIAEIGNSAGPLDYQSADELVTLFATYLAKKRANPGATMAFHLSIHQETAFKFLPRLKAVLRTIFAKATAQGILIQPSTLPFERPTSAVGSRNGVKKAKSAN